MSFRKVAVLGLGKVGHLAAELLVESGFEVTGVDARKVNAPFPTRSVDLQDQAAIADLLKGQEVELSCLPFHLNIGVSTVAHALGLRVVAEGVETDAQRDMLLALRCDELQGYLFAKPMSARAVMIWAADAPAALAQTLRPTAFKDTQPLDALPTQVAFQQTRISMQR